MRTRSLALLLLASLPCAAVTATPGDITVYMRQGLVLGAYPFVATRLPMETAITISGTGDWNIARGGDLATDCQGTWCFTAVTNPAGTICSGTLATGNGAGTVSLCWKSTNGVWLLALGSHTGTLTIGSTTINITVIVIAPFAYDAFTYLPGYPSGCSTSVAGFPHADTCTITNERPDSTAFTIPAVGGCYNDPQFGYKVCRVTPSGYNIQYSTRTAFSASSTYVLVNNAGAFVHVYNRVTAAQVYGPLPSEVNIGTTAWDAFDDDRIWYTYEGKIKYRTLGTGTTTIAANYESASGSRPAMSAITMDGETGITDDNWWVFSFGLTRFCAVNLTGLTTSNQESHTYCSADLTALGITHSNFPNITKVDRGTGKRYAVWVVAPRAHVFSVGTTGLDYEYAMPTGPPDMTVEPHSHVGEDSEGNQGFVFTYAEPYGNVAYPVFMRLSAGTLLEQPVEFGGGMKFLYSNTGAAFDNHWGCNGRGTCVLSMYSNQIAARRISSVTAANPCQITTAAPHGYSTGNSIQIGGALGITSINAVWTITSTGASTFTLNGHNCTGTYTANSAHSATFAAFSNAPNRQELVVLRPGQEIRRVAIHRNSMFDTGTGCTGGDLCSYYNSPRASPSPDGRYIAFACNFGVPGDSSICVADLGFSDDVRLTSAADPADTKALLRYNVPPNQGAATVLISATPALTSPVVNASDGLAAQSRQYVATGLIAATDYYYRVTAGQFSYTGSFRTLATLSGTGTLRIERGGGGTIEHGATSSLGSSGVSPLVLTPSRGVYYYNAGAGVVAAIVK